MSPFYTRTIVFRSRPSIDRDVTTMSVAAPMFRIFHRARPALDIDYRALDDIYAIAREL